MNSTAARPDPDAVARATRRLDALLTHLWGLHAPGANGLLAEEALLATLCERDRVLALMLRGVGASHGVDDGPARTVARLGLLTEAAEGLLAAFANTFAEDESGLAPPAPVSWSIGVLDDLWRAATRGGSFERFAAAASMALAPRLPLGLDGVEALVRVTAAANDDDIESGDDTARLAGFGTVGLLGVAIGRAAAASDWHGRALLRGALGEARLGEGQTGRHLRIGLVKGLGRGLFVPGFTALVALAEGALSQAEPWWRAVLAAWPEIEAAPGLPAALTATLALRVATGLPAALLERFLTDLPERLEGPLSIELGASWLSLRSSHRAPALRRLGRVELPEGLWRQLERERHPGVVGALLDLPSLPAEWPVNHLLRGFSDVAGAALRVRLARRLHTSSQTAGPAADRSADIISLPPAALARDEVDRLRLAIRAGDGEQLAELAARVPLDRRVEAREALVGCLDIPDAPLRRGAIAALGRIGSIADAPALVDAARRHRALDGVVASALRSLPARAAVPDLLELFTRRLKWADDDAIDDLWQLAGEGCIPFLLRGLSVRYYPIARAGAARALGRYRVQEAVFALRSVALSDTHDGTRLAASQAVGELRGVPPGPGELAGHGVLFRQADSFQDAMARARDAGAEAIPGLRRVLARGSWRRREVACQVLGTIDADSAEELLIGALTDPDDDVRLAASEALTQRGWIPTTPREFTLAALGSRRLSHLESSPELVDHDVLMGALRLGGHAFRTEVLNLLERNALRPSNDAERLATSAARLDFEPLVTSDDGLVAALRVVDQTWQAEPHRGRAAAALGRVSPARLQRALEEADLGWRAHQTVAEALAGSLAEGAAALLAELVTDEEDDVRRASLQALAWLGLGRAAAGLDAGAVAAGFEAAFRSPFPDDRDQAAAAAGTLGAALLPAVERWASDPWWETRQAAARTLGAWTRDLDRASDVLLRLAVDSEYKVAETAREALSRHGVLPSVAGRIAALEVATTASLEGLTPWFGSRADAVTHPDVAAALDQLVERSRPDSLPQRVGLIPLLGVEHLASWLEDAALGRSTTHIGIRVAASAALRGLVRPACSVCGGSARLACPACESSGAVTCARCGGTGEARVPCPAVDCSATHVTRRIDTPRCAVCHGRGSVKARCHCQDSPTPGRAVCALCGGEGTIACGACVPSAD
jgi:HEAT repeat protein